MFWLRILGICLAVVFIAGCTAKQKKLTLESDQLKPDTSRKIIKPDEEDVTIAPPKPVVLKTIAKVTAHRLNLREKGSSKSRIIGVLKKNEELMVISRNGNWFKIQSPQRVIGWVYYRYVSRFKEVPIIPPGSSIQSSPNQNNSKVKNVNDESAIIVEDLKPESSRSNSKK